MRGAIVHARIAAIRGASQGAVIGLLEYLGEGLLVLFLSVWKITEGKVCQPAR